MNRSIVPVPDRIPSPEATAADARRNRAGRAAKGRFPRLVVKSLCVSLVFSMATARAQLPVQVVDKVEEDWRLVVAVPNQTAVGPQITTCMSPVGNHSTAFVAFDMNYREFPSFSPGGLQLQVWSNNTVTATASQGTAQFATANEVVTWTQQMSISNGTVNYSINNGRSTTWGRFGQGYGPITVSFTTTLNDLALYSPDESFIHSGVSWQSNNVTSMTLVQVRYYSGGLLIATDSTPRSVSLAH